MTKKPILSRGAEGSAVKELQSYLKNAGMYKGLKDGLFGPATERAVVKFQRREKLSTDGVVGGETWRRLQRRPDPSYKDKPHTLFITRRWETSESTISEVKLVTDENREILFECYILERPGPDCAQSGQRRRVVEGWHKMKWQTRTGLSGVQPHLPVPWIYSDEIPEDRYIYIHNGNEPKHTDGCLLTGKTKSKDFVSHSVDTLDKLKDYLSDIGITNVRVKISSDYEAE